MTTPPCRRLLMELRCTMACFLPHACCTSFDYSLHSTTTFFSSRFWYLDIYSELLLLCWMSFDLIPNKPCEKAIVRANISSHGLIIDGIINDYQASKSFEEEGSLRCQGSSYCSLRTFLLKNLGEVIRNFNVQQEMTTSFLSGVNTRH